MRCDHVEGLSSGCGRLGLKQILPATFSGCFWKKFYLNHEGHGVLGLGLQERVDHRLQRLLDVVVVEVLGRRCFVSSGCCCPRGNEEKSVSWMLLSSRYWGVLNPGIEQRV